MNDYYYCLHLWVCHLLSINRDEGETRPSHHCYCRMLSKIVVDNAERNVGIVVVMMTVVVRQKCCCNNESCYHMEYFK